MKISKVWVHWSLKNLFVSCVGIPRSPRKQSSSPSVLYGSFQNTFWNISVSQKFWQNAKTLAIPNESNIFERVPTTCQYVWIRVDSWYPCEIKLEDVWPAWILGIFGKLFTVCWPIQACTAWIVSIGPSPPLPTPATGGYHGKPRGPVDDWGVSRSNQESSKNPPQQPRNIHNYVCNTKSRRKSWRWLFYSKCARVHSSKRVINHGTPHVSWMPDSHELPTPPSNCSNYLSIGSAVFNN